MADEFESEYNDTHRAFLQALFARQTITYAAAKPLLASIQSAATPDRPTLPEDVSEADFEAYVHALNSALSPFDLEIRSALHQKRGKERVFALVNTTSDALTQLSTTHSADEIAFVKRVLDGMFDRNNTREHEVMAMTSMQALKMAKPPGDANRRSQAHTQSAQAGLTMSQAERVLGSLVAEGWFELSSAGFYSLTPRALMELRGWLMETYDDPPDDDEEEHKRIKFCRACQEIVTVGQRCPDLECAARLHNHCVRGMFRAQGNEEKCPICKTDWIDAPPVGEKAAKRRRTTEGSTGGARRRPGGTERNVATGEEQDTDGDADED